MSQTNKTPDTGNSETQRLGFLEAVGQAFSLIFAVQNKAGRQRLMGMAETNPLPVLFSGFLSTLIFFSFCFITSRFFIYLLTH